MKKIVPALACAALGCAALSACSHYTEATGPNGGTLKQITIAPGTSITTPNGSCINSAGGNCDIQPASTSVQ